MLNSASLINKTKQNIKEGTEQTKKISENMKLNKH